MKQQSGLIKQGFDKDVKFAVAALSVRWTFYQFVFLWTLTVSELPSSLKEERKPEGAEDKAHLRSFCVGWL